MWFSTKWTPLYLYLLFIVRLFMFYIVLIKYSYYFFFFNNIISTHLCSRMKEFIALLHLFFFNILTILFNIIIKSIQVVIYLVIWVWSGWKFIQIWLLIQRYFWFVCILHMLDIYSTFETQFFEIEMILCACRNTLWQ